MYEVSDTETVTCEATEDILLVIFDEPVLEMNFAQAILPPTAMATFSRSKISTRTCHSS